MSQDAAAGEHKPHVLPIHLYLGVWASLIVLTVITVWVSYHDYGNLNIYVAMAVATVKASLVVLFFMHLKYDEPFNGIVFVGTLLCLGIFVALTMADFKDRGHVNPIVAREIHLNPSREGGAAGHGMEAAAEGETAPAGEEMTGEGVPGTEPAVPVEEEAKEEPAPVGTGSSGH